MTRLFISIIVAVLGSLFFIGWGLDKLVAHQGEPEANSEFVLYQKLIEGFSQQLSQMSPEQLQNESQRLGQMYQLDVAIEDSNNVALPATLSSQLSQQGGLLLASDEQAYLLRKIPAHEQFLIRLALPPNSEENHQGDVMLTAVLYIGVCAILMLWLFPLARRLYVLTNSAAKIGKGELNVRVPINQFSYIRPLEKSFNQMAAQIEKLMADNKLLARSLSHDIRTPMSCLRFGIEAAMDCQDQEKKDGYLQRIEAELTRMEDMTSAFLSYAGMERQGVNLKLESVEFSTFIQEFAQDIQSLAEQHHIELELHMPEQATPFELDCHWFHRALQNLVSNAIQYANQKVVIRLIQSTKDYTLCIEDDGKGIEADKLAVVFDPFVKLDVDRSREQGHFGLGLAICQKVVHWHNGEIIAGNSKALSGAQFTLHLPR